ncbi:hypothetical protein COOONC_11821 [Cooperia oncophora]
MNLKHLLSRNACGDSSLLDLLRCPGPNFSSSSGLHRHYPASLRSKSLVEPLVESSSSLQCAYKQGHAVQSLMLYTHSGIYNTTKQHWLCSQDSNQEVSKTCL